MEVVPYKIPRIARLCRAFSSANQSEGEGQHIWVSRGVDQVELNLWLAVIQIGYKVTALKYIQVDDLQPKPF